MCQDGQNLESLACYSETSMLCTSPPTSSLVSGVTPASVSSTASTAKTSLDRGPQLPVHLQAIESQGCAAASPPSNRLTPSECITALVEPSCANASSHSLRIRSLIAASFDTNPSGNSLAFATHALTIIFEVLARRMETQTCVHLDNAWAAAEFVAWIAEDYVPILLDTVTTPVLQMEALSILLNICLAVHVPSSHMVQANRARVHAPALLFLKRSNVVDANTLKVWMHSLRALENLEMMHLTGLSNLLMEYDTLEGKYGVLLQQDNAVKISQRTPCFVKVPKECPSLPACMIRSTGEDGKTQLSMKGKATWLSLLGF
ncbi:hypothetical protein BC830DRAFT_937338 [Chytriomyces sp. MP71]|nr:hypothetical protein BC830DRAFT_937338 [Chytriomyces sp. MP71]